MTVNPLQSDCAYGELVPDKYGMLWVKVQPKFIRVIDAATYIPGAPKGAHYVYLEPQSKNVMWPVPILDTLAANDERA